MAVGAQLRIDITANNKSAIAGIKQVDKAVAELKDALVYYQDLAFSEKDVNKLRKYNSEIQKLQAQLKQTTNVGKVGFDEMGVAVQGGTNALTKTYSGLRQIAYILPGIGIAGIFNLAFEAIAKAANELGIFDDKAKKAAEDVAKFKNELDESAGKSLQASFSLKAYLDIARDLAKPMAERNEALKKANELYGHHNEALTLANINTKEVKEQVEGYTQALIASAIAAKYGDRIAESFAKQRSAARIYGEEIEKLNKLKAARDRDLKDNGGLILQEGGATTSDAINKYNSQLRKTVDATNAYKDATKNLSIETGDYISVLNKANELNSKFGETDKGHGKIIKDKIEKLKEWHQLVGSIRETVGRQEDRGYKPFDINKEQRLDQGKGIDFTALFGEDHVKKGEDNLKEYNKQLAQTTAIANAAANAFDSLFKAMDQGQSLGDALGKMFQDLAKQIAEAAVKALVFTAVLNIIAPGSGTLGGSLGGAKKAPGFFDMFKGLLGFASGGTVSGPSSGYPVLLHGTEHIVRPDQMNKIVGGAAQMGAAMGGGSQTINIVGRIAGNDIWLSKQRTDYQRGLTA